MSSAVITPLDKTMSSRILRADGTLSPDFHLDTDASEHPICCAMLRCPYSLMNILNFEETGASLMSGITCLQAFRHE